MTPRPDAADRTTGKPAAFGRLDNQGRSRRLGDTLPANSDPVESRCTHLVITVKRGQGFQSYRFLSNQAYVYYPCDVNGLLKPLVGDCNLRHR